VWWLFGLFLEDFRGRIRKIILKQSCRYFNTFPMSLDSFFTMSIPGVMNFWRLLSVLFVRIVGLVHNLFKVVFRNLRSRIWVGLSTKSCRLSQYRSNQYLFTFFHWVFCELWILKSAVLQLEDRKQSHFVNCFRSIRFQNLIIFWIQSCSLFNLDACRIFVFYHCYCGIQKWEVTPLLLFGWRGLFLSVVGWERRIVILVDCFMCMFVLLLRIVDGKVVLLRIMLNFVA
jgi:hypothetical protein